jgi:hypothetical protein
MNEIEDLLTASQAADTVSTLQRLVPITAPDGGFVEVLPQRRQAAAHLRQARSFPKCATTAPWAAPRFGRRTVLELQVTRAGLRVQA